MRHEFEKFIDFDLSSQNGDVNYTYVGNISTKFGVSTSFRSGPMDPNGTERQSDRETYGRKASFRNADLTARAGHDRHDCNMDNILTTLHNLHLPGYHVLKV